MFNFILMVGEAHVEFRKWMCEEIKKVKIEKKEEAKQKVVKIAVQSTIDILSSFAYLVEGSWWAN